MVFNSLAFVCFAAVVFPLVHLLPKRAQNVALLLASYVFYGWWDWRFCGLLLLSTVVDFSAATFIEDHPAKKKLGLLLSVGVNVGVLCFFKYFNFFVDSFLAMTADVGLAPSAALVRVALPIGISFYTFQTMAYTIDVYRGRMKATRDPWVFALYVAFFPQLVAGPIERAERLLPQIAGNRVLTADFVRSGVTLLLIGWFKKVGLADGVAPYVDEIYADPGSYSGSAILLAMQLFLVQLYGDFSGYSDMARGSARLLGVDLMINFKRPYLSADLSTFWRNWHVSLSSWFKDYLYVPLGGSRNGELRTWFNVFVVFTVSGAWHGAGWDYLLFGWINVAAMVVLRSWSKLPFVKGTVRTGSVRWFAGVFLTVQVFALSLLPFRADGIAGVWTATWAVLQNPFWLGLEKVFVVALVVYAIPVVILDVLQFRSGTEEPMLSWPRWGQGTLLGAAIVWILVLGGVDVEVPFLYFQF